MLFSFVTNLKAKIQDMKTICKLCSGAEKYANIDGEEKPGAEHFLLSALDLPDGTARNVFEQINIDPAGVYHAIKKQHRDALSNIGIDQDSIKIDLNASEKVKVKSIPYDVQPSGRDLMQKVFQINKDRKVPLVGAQILEVIASMEYGVAARTIRAMGINSIAFKKAIKTQPYCK